MQQHQHQGGGSQYGAPPPTDMGPFSTPPPAGPVPLSSRPPPPTQQQQQPQPSYDELAGAGGFPDDDMLGGDSGGNSGGALGSGGNRWPREETLALIRIRSEMDATFRDATLKGPLWEDVSRKLADLGYKRNAKKCKEKFENVHKYYKRTKEGRAGRQDGKSYRFFQELEALHGPLARSPLPPVSTAPQMSAIMPPPPGPIQPAPISSAAPAPAAVEHPQPPPVSLQGLNFPSMSESESDDDDSEDDDMTAETGGGSPDGLGKRKRVGGRKMMVFFEGLMKQVIQRQEEMQVKFLESMEKREAERTAREEAWRRQEVARLNREQEQLAHDRAAAASRDASIIAFLQRIGAQTLQAPPVVIPMPMQVQTPPPPKQPRQQLTPLPPSPQVAAQPKPIPATPLQQQPKPIPASPLQQQPKPIPAAPIQQQPPPPAQPQPQHKETTTQQEAGTPRSAPAPPSGGSSLALVPVVAEQHVEAVEGGGGASSSRWPKTEVHALIQLRMDMDNRYQENGPKGPLWEEISAGMRRLGYNRNSKRCKEKWENINKYFKKVKESNKRRPEDSKTCPYFHQLEAIYRKKHISSAAAGNAVNAVVSVPAAVTEQQQLSLNRHEIEGKKINDIDKRDNGGIGAAQGLASNGQTMPTTATLDIDLGAKKPEDTLRELGEQPHREFTTDETDSDDMGEDYTDDGEDGEDDGNMQYRIQFQRPNPVGTNNASPPAATPTTVVPTSTPASSFLAMVK
uniref:Uncharacterized protein n=1 Tax=Avena sativa TaxID=4498 RepID=A0ACD5UDB8_AVESA